MIPIIRNEVINKKNWLTDKEINNYLVLSQSIPGVIAINLATSIGKKVCGITGAITSTIGIITFPVLIIIFIAKHFNLISQHEVTQKIFDAIQALSISMIMLTIIFIYKSNIKDWFQFVIFILGVISIIFCGIAPQYVIIFSGLIGLVYRFFLKKLRRS